MLTVPRPPPPGGRLAGLSAAAGAPRPRLLGGAGVRGFSGETLHAASFAGGSLSSCSCVNAIAVRIAEEFFSF